MLWRWLHIDWRRPWTAAPGRWVVDHTNGGPS